MGIEVYVGQISGSVNEDELRKLFSVVGTVASVHLVIDPVSGESRGCGYVRMSTEEEARELGVREYMLKPVSTRRLAEVVRRVLDADGQPKQ